MNTKIWNHCRNFDNLILFAHALLIKNILDILHALIFWYKQSKMTDIENLAFFSFWLFFFKHLRIMGQQGKRKPISWLLTTFSTHFGNADDILDRQLLQKAHICK